MSKSHFYYVFVFFLLVRQEKAQDVFLWITFIKITLPALRVDASLFTLEKRLAGRKPRAFAGFSGVVFLEPVSVCEVPGLWRALNER